MKMVRQIRVIVFGIIVLLIIGCGRLKALPDDQESTRWPTTLEALQYYYSPKVLGSGTSLGLNRSGYVSYSYSSQPHTGSGGNIVVKEWRIPEQEAAQILDALVNAGILELGIGMDGGIKMPSHVLTFSSKGWQKVIRPTRLPDAVWKQMLSLMVHAHPEMWKKDTQQDAAGQPATPPRIGD
jgi:hypothetical protein